MPFFDPCVVVHGGTNLGYSPKGTHIFYLTVSGEINQLTNNGDDHFQPDTLVTIIFSASLEVELPALGQTS